MSPRQIGHQADVGWRAFLSWSANQEFGANAQLPRADSINPEHVTIRRHFPVQFPAVQSFRRCSIHVIMFINSRPDHCKAFVIQMQRAKQTRTHNFVLVLGCKLLLFNKKLRTRAFPSPERCVSRSYSVQLYSTVFQNVEEWGRLPAWRQFL